MSIEEELNIYRNNVIDEILKLFPRLTKKQGCAIWLYCINCDTVLPNGTVHGFTFRTIARILADAYNKVHKNKVTYNQFYLCNLHYRKGELDKSYILRVGRRLRNHGWKWL